MSSWYWEYNENQDRWYFHTPEYRPEVSFVVYRQEDRQFIARWGKTSMPESIQKVITKIGETTNFYDLVPKGIRRVTVNRDMVKECARSLSIMSGVWRQVPLKGVQYDRKHL